jgi:hypothetical protein
VKAPTITALTRTAKKRKRNDSGIDENDSEAKMCTQKHLSSISAFSIPGMNQVIPNLQAINCDILQM